MAKAKCIICGKPAKRICPLEHNRVLCALCCRKIVEDPHKNCAQDCPFLAETREYIEDKWLEKLPRLLLEEPGHFFMNISERGFEVVNLLLRSIKYALRNEDEFTDEELKNALKALRYELIASRSGLIYDASPLGGRTLRLFSTLRDYLQFHKRERGNLQDPKKFILDEYEREGVEEAFDFLERLIRRHQAPDGNGYITFFRSIVK